MSPPINSSDLYGKPGALNVTAVLGPTNTGKTHLAIERMLGYQSGLIGLPLRLLAREVYDKIVARIGPSDVALITGEEKIKPKNARYWISTVEAMPRDIDVEFVAIDEIQLAADPERGHVFTDRLFHARGSEETLLLGAETMRTALNNLIPGLNFISRPRLSKLSYTGSKKISRMPRRTAIVAFSARDVYEIAELIRRQRGGAAVVLGALSPRTRNAQVAMYQSGEVDFLVATDAIGMGLNLDVHHVAFAGNRKFDGINHRDLFPAEIAQIAGRAGRHINDGTFGVTGDVQPFDSDVINRIEAHDFDPVGGLQWRARSLDYASLPRLLASLKLSPEKPFLQKARDADDLLALESLANDPKIIAYANGPAHVQRLWEVCQLPDYRKIGVGEHTELVKQLFHFIMQDEGLIPTDWLAQQIEQQNRVDGDIDTLAARLAYMRTWTFVANRVDWLDDPAYWQGRTREVEDNLSDALHEALTKRFVDKRTSTLMKRLRDKDELYVEIDDQGQILVEDHYVGKISGFQFTPDETSAGVNGRAARAAATQVLTKELAMRSEQIIAAEKSEFSFSATGELLWKEDAVAQLQKGDHILKPMVVVLADEQLSGSARDDVTSKIQKITEDLIAEKLAPLVNMHQAQEFAGMARGIAFQLTENLGILERGPIANDVRQLDQEARRQLRKYGVRFGAFNIYFPLLLKPAAAELCRLLWLVNNDKLEQASEWVLPRPGLTSAAFDKTIDVAYYKTAGFHVCGNRIVRVDMLERLADQIRPLVSWRKPKAKAASAPVKADEKKAENSGTDKLGTEQPVADKKELGSDAEVMAEANAVSEDASATTETQTGDAEQPIKTDTTPVTEAQSTDGQTLPVKEAATAQDASSLKEAASADKISEKELPKEEVAPAGATGDGGFTVVPEMMSIMGCSADELGEVLRSLGFYEDKKSHKPAVPAVTQTQDHIDTAGAENAAPTVNEDAEVQKPNSDAEIDAGTEKRTDSEAEVEASAEKEEVIVIWRPRKKAGGGRYRGDKRAGSQARQGGQHKQDNKQSDEDEGGKKSSFKHKGRHGQKGRHKNGRGANGQGTAHGKGKSGKNGQGSHSHKPPREKKMDPDSPFAKLQILKDQIKDNA